MSKSAKRIAFTAIFVALSVLTNIFTMFVGSGAVGVSFAYLPIFLSGVFFGPFTGFAVGVTGDLLGCLIHPMGPWIPLITLSSGLIGLIPGLIFKLPAGKILKNVRAEAAIKIALGMLLILAFCTAGFNTLGLWLTYSASKKTFWVYLAGRLPLQLPTFFVNFALLYVLYPNLKKLLARYYDYDKDLPRADARNAAIAAPAAGETGTERRRSREPGLFPGKPPRLISAKNYGRLKPNRNFRGRPPRKVLRNREFFFPQRISNAETAASKRPAAETVSRPIRQTKSSGIPLRPSRSDFA